MSQVSDVAEKENQEPIADEVITMEPELNLSFCRVFTFNKYSSFLTSLVICIHETDCGEWTLLLSFCVGVKFGVLHQEKNTD
jgi:hypothetical protein